MAIASSMVNTSGFIVYPPFRSFTPGASPLVKTTPAASRAKRPGLAGWVRCAIEVN
jgi:hypothetical protein